MKKKVLIISTSLRNGSNSDILAEEFAKGAQDAGHDISKISLAEKAINFCKGCLVCQTTHRCVIQDDAVKIAEEMSSSDVIAFATPVYYYEMSGQMKTLLDRANPLYGTDYKFRDIYLIATAAEGEKSAMDGAANGLQGWLDCFPKTELKNVICGNGATMPNEIKGNPAMQEAYEAGKAI